MQGTESPRRVESGTPGLADVLYGWFIRGRTATAHGWEIDVTESEEGGARFEILTRPSVQDTAQTADDSQ